MPPNLEVDEVKPPKSLLVTGGRTGLASKKVGSAFLTTPFRFGILGKLALGGMVLSIIGICLGAKGNVDDYPNLVGGLIKELEGVWWLI